MADPDTGRKNLRGIIDEFKTFCDGRGTVSEADTRAKVITKVLRDVLFWPENEIDREPVSDIGRLDYRLRVNGKHQVVVEAKRQDIAFTVPVDGFRKTYTIGGALCSDRPTKEAIHQVREYCDEEGIRYAIATNGHAWIVFRAIRDDNIGWKKGHARVFVSLEDIFENRFTEFWNLLSYQNISVGSLNKEFGTTLRASRELHRVIALLFNANLPLRRNRLNKDLQPIIRLVFEDIADQEELDVLHACYIHTGTLRTVANDLDHVITESIPRFLLDEGTKPVGSDYASDGLVGSLRSSVRITKGELFLLLGGIGSGKSTFLKRYQKTTGHRLLDTKTMWFSVDFIRPPGLAEMESFVWQSVLDAVRSRYANRECEKRRYVKEVFAADITALDSTILGGYKQGTQRYEQALSPYLHEWSRNLSKYVPGIVRVACKRLDLKPVLFIDNVDQLKPDYQAQIFLLAQRVTGLLSSITVVALREESYYTANVKNTFTAYSTRKFHIASPHFRRMIGNRIEYALSRLQMEGSGDTAVEKFTACYDFLRIVEGGILENERIARFIKSICYGNMRLALEMFCTFVTSGATDVDKMLKIYYRDGWYNLAHHEFVKAVMLGDRAYYKEEQSPICNVFNVGSEPNSSHFTAWRIIRSLIEHRGASTLEGVGYVALSRMIVEFESVFDNVEDFLAAINRLVSRHLVEPNTRSPETVEGASHVRVTSAGWYYVRHLVPTFAYLDLVLQDTPINNQAVEKELRNSVYEVNNLLDDEDKKLERVRARFRRVEKFLDYLEKEEQGERAEFGLAKLDTPIAESIVGWIRSKFEKERDWIDRRLSENREKYKEEFADVTYTDEEKVFVDEDEPETVGEPATTTGQTAKATSADTA